MVEEQQVEVVIDHVHHHADGETLFEVEIQYRRVFGDVGFYTLLAVNELGQHQWHESHELVYFLYNHNILGLDG